MSGPTQVRAVAITGVGLVTPVGLTAPVVWDALLAGKSGVRAIEGFDTEQLVSRIAGQIPDFQPKQWIKQRKSLKMMPLGVQIGMAAGRMALEDAKLPEVPPDRFGVTIGTGSGGGELDLVAHAIETSVDDQGKFDIVKFGSKGMHEINPLWLLRGLSNAVMGHISAAYQMRGYNTNICNSGASGLQAIGDGARAIAHGRTDVVLAGGYDAVVNPQYLVRFERLGLLTKQQEPEGASRPFDAERDGFVAADGAGFVVLEAMDAARERGATIYGEVLGYGSASDSGSFLDPQPEGEGLGRSMAAALDDAQISGEDVQVVFAHAPGTQPYDRAETLAIKRAVGPHVLAPAIKSELGHCIAASGAVAAAVAACALKHQCVPPTINRAHPDPDCDLDCVPDLARDVDARHVLINASGLGGIHTSVVLARGEE